MLRLFSTVALLGNVLIPLECVQLTRSVSINPSNSQRGPSSFSSTSRGEEEEVGNLGSVDESTVDAEDLSRIVSIPENNSWSMCRCLEGPKALIASLRDGILGKKEEIDDLQREVTILPVSRSRFCSCLEEVFSKTRRHSARRLSGEDPTDSAEVIADIPDEDLSREVHTLPVESSGGCCLCCWTRKPRNDLDREVRAQPYFWCPWGSSAVQEPPTERSRSGGGAASSNVMRRLAGGDDVPRVSALDLSAVRSTENEPPTALDSFREVCHMASSCCQGQGAAREFVESDSEEEEEEEEVLVNMGGHEVEIDQIHPSLTAAVEDDPPREGEEEVDIIHPSPSGGVGADSLREESPIPYHNCPPPADALIVGAGSGSAEQDEHVSPASGMIGLPAPIPLDDPVGVPPGRGEDGEGRGCCSWFRLPKKRGQRVIPPRLPGSELN